METITVKEALKQGYTLCGYEDLEMQGLKNIDNLEQEDFEPHHGYLCVANKQSNSASISSEEVIEWLTDRYNYKKSRDKEQIEEWAKDLFEIERFNIQLSMLDQMKIDLLMRNLDKITLNELENLI